MTWQHFLRTLVVAILGAAALAVASQARAEGGEGPTLVSPEKAEQFMQELGMSDGEAAAEASDADNIEQTAAIPLKAELKLRTSDAERASALKPLIARYASENNLPYELADAVVRIESRYNPGARNGPHMGLTQINFRTAQSLGYQGAAAGLLDAETNLRYGLKYLAQAYKLAGGDTCGAILRYQAGHRAQTMTNAARAYCAKVKVITAAAN